ncbi:hypothetical protein BDW74DRAFT_18669 [Aspergillus multicolor]|uniref:uncharacterized protein n=1 Tax=Aspergillus multicolor TaxID=41759 RepID=UPI003CCD7DDE
MHTPTHIIDPDGEVVIVLRNANAPFAGLEQVIPEAPAAGLTSPKILQSTVIDSHLAEEEINDTPPPSMRRKKKGKKGKRGGHYNAGYEEATPALEESYAEPEPEPAAESEYPAEPVTESEYPAEPAPEPVEEPVPEAFEGPEYYTVHEAPAEPDEAPIEPAEEAPAEDLSTWSIEEPAPEPSYSRAPSPKPAAEPVAIEGEPIPEAASEEANVCRIQVSAKHLALASPVFKKTPAVRITNTFHESDKYHENGSNEVDVENWDIDALLILLHAIHGKHNAIPRQLSLEMMAKVAVLADHYDCKEAVGIWARHIWIHNLQETPAMCSSHDLALWLWISWFFELPAKFQECTAIAKAWGGGDFDAFGLPIPEHVIEVINGGRNYAIESIISQLDSLRNDFLTGKRGCHFECASMMYGALTKEMHLKDLLSPVPLAPFSGLNYKSLVKRVRSFKEPVWYSTHGTYHLRQHECPDSEFASVLGDFDESIEGLELASLLP